MAHGWQNGPTDISQAFRHVGVAVAADQCDDHPVGIQVPVACLARTWNERAVPGLSRWMGQISCTLENDTAAGLLLVLLVVAFMLLALS